jgi:hypothetical protein
MRRGEDYPGMSGLGWERVKVTARSGGGAGLLRFMRD